MKMQAEGLANAIATDALSKFLFLFHVFPPPQFSDVAEVPFSYSHKTI
jgi:hypothetical protein